MNDFHRKYKFTLEIYSILLWFMKNINYYIIEYFKIFFLNLHILFEN